MIELPLLTEEQLMAPCLVFPPTLTSKNRKMVHECCAETGLFHITAGKRFSKTNRTICVSIYRDGFDAIQDIDPYYAFLVKDKETKVPPESESYHPSIRQFRPWYCLRDRTWLAGDDGKKLTDPFIDNPELSIREDMDDMDFEKWDTQDLSDVPSPTCSKDQFTIVDSREKMLECAKQLKTRRPTEIGFDLESYNVSKFTQLTCLLQITSDYGHDFVIDTLAPGVWDEIGPSLALLFADPKIVKVGHSIGGLDVRSLHRDFGIFVVNAFDTYEAAKVLSLKSHGLASVCQYYGLRESDHYKELKELYQTSDWRRRPLTTPMVEYGRYDVHYLLKLRKLMIRDLTRAELFDRTPTEISEEARLVASSLAATFSQFREDEDDWTFENNQDDDTGNQQATHATSINSNEDFDDGNDYGAHDPSLDTQNKTASAALLRMNPDLMTVLSRSQERTRDLWSGKEEPYRTHPMYVNIRYRAKRSELSWKEEHDKLLHQIIEWRNSLAKDLEVLPGFVAPLEFLIPVALQRPTSELGLRRVGYRLPELLETEKRHVEGLLSVIAQSLTSEDEEFLPSYDDRLSCGRRHNPYSISTIKMTLALGLAVGVVLVTSQWKVRSWLSR
mmetsp:Transcript_4053/g.10332  ORF Transcript_4053/g.10332 Transcript_4053/m.10332 type:complete len:615 (+) Transcript_4053:3-1847(+)